MDSTIAEENLIRAANYNKKLQPKLTPRNQPLKNMYTEHQQPTVQNTTRRAESNSQKLCKEKQKNKIQPILTPTPRRAMDKQDQNTQHKKMNYTKNELRKTKIVNNKIMDEKLKTAMKTWLEQKCSQNEKS